MGFLKDSMNPGYLDPSWVLTAVKAGDELRTGGAPFTSRALGVSVNVLKFKLPLKRFWTRFK
jgi:hypothetical protein